MRKIAISICGLALAAGLTFASVSAGEEQPENEQALAPASSLAAAGANGPTADEQTYSYMVGLSAYGSDPRVEEPLPSRASMAPIEESRLLYAGEQGRVSMVPTVDDSGFCYMVKPNSAQSGGLVGCLRAFDKSGLNLVLAGSDVEEAASLAGIAADDVASIELMLASGKTEVVTVEGNGFFAEVPSGDLPTAIVTHFRDGTTHRQAHNFSLAPGPVPAQDV